MKKKIAGGRCKVCTDNNAPEKTNVDRFLNQRALVCCRKGVKNRNNRFEITGAGPNRAQKTKTLVRARCCCGSVDQDARQVLPSPPYNWIQMMARHKLVFCLCRVCNLFISVYTILYLHISIPVSHTTTYTVLHIPRVSGIFTICI